MKTWIALFRGINVGGHHIVPMAELRSELELLGFSNVRTYIQSGNVVFDAASDNPSSISSKIGDRMEQRFGFRPHVFILECQGLVNAIDRNPFSDAVSDPKSLHFYFLDEPAADADLDAIEQDRSPTERFELTSRVFYFHAPDGIGRSRLAARAEKHLGVVATGRNYRTVKKIFSMLK